MKILVSGAAGYIGAHLIQELLSKNYNILALSGRSSAKVSRLSEIGVSGVSGDVRDYEFMKKVFDDFQPSIIIHLASLKSPEESNKEGEIYLKNNHETLENIFRLAKTHKVKGFIFASSSAVYGDIDSMSINETDIGNPLSNYGVIKKLGEDFLSSNNFELMKVCSLRLFNVIGSSSTKLRDNANFHLVPATVSRIKSGLAPIIYGNNLPTPDGTAIRDFVHIKDVTRAINLLIQFLMETRDFPEKNLILNVGSGQGTSVLTVVNLIQEYLGSSFEAIKRSGRSGDPISVVSNISKISQLLDWTPRYSIEEMIGSCI